jgi:hypothetical protein
MPNLSQTKAPPLIMPKRSIPHLVVTKIVRWPGQGREVRRPRKGRTEYISVARTFLSLT